MGVDDDFFAVGGDSIKSIQVVARAKRAGVVLSPRDVFERRSVASLCDVAVLGGVDERRVLPELPGGGCGQFPVLPVGQHFLGEVGYGRFMQSLVVELPEEIDHAGVVATLGAVFDRHDVLRSRLVTGGDGWDLSVPVPVPGGVDVASLVRRVGVPGGLSGPRWQQLCAQESVAAADRLDPEAGVMAQFVWFEPEAPGEHRHGRLLLVLHHLVVDGVSWRVLVPDLVSAWDQIRVGSSTVLDPVGTSMRRWAHGLAVEATDPRRVAELSWWCEMLDRPDPVLGARRCDPAVDVVATVEQVVVTVPVEVTDAVLTMLPAAYRAGANDGLLAALGMAVTEWRRGQGLEETSTLIRLEGHGREESVLPGADLSRTVGWFTTVFPVRVDVSGIDLTEAFAGAAAAGQVIKAVKEQLVAVPDKGIGYGLLRHLNAETRPKLAAYPSEQIGFNYLGKFSMVDTAGGAGWTPTGEDDEFSGMLDPRMPVTTAIDINAIVRETDAGDQLVARFAFPAGVLSGDDVERLARLWIAALSGLAGHVRACPQGGLTPSDVRSVTVQQREIDVWSRRYPGLADIWPLTPLQAGLLYHAKLADSSFDAYIVQLVLQFDGPVDGPRLRRAGQAILDRHASLRTAFVPSASGQTVQLVVDGVELPWREIDLSDREPAHGEELLEQFLREDREVHFDVETAPLMRMALVRTGEQRFEFAVTFHHILLDGWSLQLLMKDLFAVFGADTTVGLPRVRSYGDFLAWLTRQDPSQARQAWPRALAGVVEPPLLARVLPAGAEGGAGGGSANNRRPGVHGPVRRPPG
nr:condensation domain-containing protein [Nocardia abscessus]